MRRMLYFLIGALVMLSSCKKDPTAVGNMGSVPDLIKDSVYAYAQEDYLWYDAMPAYKVFKPRQYTSSTLVDALQNEVDALSQLKINTATGLPYEYNTRSPGESKYSYIDEGQAATIIGGTGGDFGFSLFYQAYNDLRVKYVYAGSPAGNAGLVRGYKITAVNGSSNIYYPQNSASPATDANVAYVVNALAGNTLTLTLQKPDGSTLNATLNRGSYTINPVLKYTTLTTSGGKTVGYFAFNQFTDLSNAKTKIDEAFNYFTTKGITDLVVDLRYNGGGSVETSAYLANWIVPTAKSNTTMFTAYFNTRLQNDDYPLLAKKFQINKGDFSAANNTEKFSKQGTLNLGRVFFLVTGNTASASELLINNLRPTMNVQIIGQTTYGKPTAFFSIPVANYDLYLVEIENRNAASQADFYQGMIPGSTNFPGYKVTDDITKDFGDPAEALLAQALYYVDKSAYKTTGYQTLSTSSVASLSEDAVKDLNNALTNDKFKGMVINKVNHKRLH